MYEQFFGLTCRPFDLTSDPRFAVLTESHREALHTLEYGIAARKGLMVLIGEAGSGKTTLVRTAIARQARGVHTVHLTNPTLSRSEFVELLAARFGLSQAARASKAAMLLELEPLLRSRAAEGETTLLVVDEAQSLPGELLEEVRLLANIESDEQKLLQVVLVGQPELGGLLDEHDLRQLKQRVALRASIGRLDARDTAACVSGRVREAGGSPADTFSRDAVARLHARAGGLLRVVSVLADNALLAAFAAGQKPVTAALVDEAARGLGLADAGAGPAAAEPEPQARAAVVVEEPVQVAADELVATGARSEMFGTFSAKRRRFALFGS
jgi:type II secretory pathway predicted ATPase ExeA